MTTTYQGAPRVAEPIVNAMVRHQHESNVVRQADCHETPTIRTIQRERATTEVACYWRCDACGWGGWYDAPGLGRYPNHWYANDCDWRLDGETVGHGRPS